MKKASDSTLLMREAIYQALGDATEPLSAYDLMQHSAFQGMGFSSGEVSIGLSHMYNATKPEFKIARIPSGNRTSQWVYFRPDVVRLEYTEPVRKPKPAAKPAEPEVPAPEFKFNPVEFETQQPPPAAPPIVLTEGAKSITLTVGGVTITIEMK